MPGAKLWLQGHESVGWPMSDDEKLTTINIRLEQRFHDELANWASNLEPPASVEMILQPAAIMLAMDEPTREQVAQRWQEAAPD
jgi:hypothetical protein